jgi:hypothetical protein
MGKSAHPSSLAVGTTTVEVEKEMNEAECSLPTELRFGLAARTTSFKGATPR